MSAWIVSKKHIDVLVAAVDTHGEWNLSRTALGRLLWNENLESLKYRYPNDSDGTRPGPNNFRDDDVNTYKYRTPGAELTTPVVALKLAHSYDYQSCEHPEWTNSAARRIVRSLIDTLKTGVSEESAEYEEAPWSI